MKKRLALLAGLLCIALSSCGDGPPAVAPALEPFAPADEGPARLVVFADASLSVPLDQLSARYRAASPGVSIVCAYDESDTLLQWIQDGAECDVFLSAAPASADAPDAIRVELLENRVVLAVPEGNPAGIRDFSHLAQLLNTGEVLLAVGQSEQPYAQAFYSAYFVTGAAVSRVLSVSDGREAAARIAEWTADCGIIPAPDAAALGLDTIEDAGTERCTAAVLPGGETEQARAFLEYLSGKDAGAVFTAAGFIHLPTLPPPEPEEPPEEEWEELEPDYSWDET